jgi:hypothetical protein
MVLSHKPTSCKNTSEIDARNLNGIKAITQSEVSIPQIPDIQIIPSIPLAESSSFPLSVQAMNDRLKDMPTGLLPQLPLSFDRPSAEYGPTEFGNLVGNFSVHKDNFGREVLTLGENFSMEPQMVLLGMGIAVLAAAAYFKRNEITKFIKRW